MPVRLWSSPLVSSVLFSFSCVIVVGLPYPNSKDPIIVERMAYFDRQTTAAVDNSLSAISGSAYYRGLCLKNVNQCVGRAIRHAKDWSSIVFFDRRYLREDVSIGIAGWVREN